MPSLNRNGKVIYEECGTKTVRTNRACLKQTCSVGNSHCTKGPTFSTTCQNSMNYHMAKKYSAP